jgi:hypothetical protein
VASEHWCSSEQAEKRESVLLGIGWRVARAAMESAPGKIEAAILRIVRERLGRDRKPAKRRAGRPARGGAA